MSEADNTQHARSSYRQAIEVLKALSHFDFPDDVSQVQDWLQKTKPLQLMVRWCCDRDRTGRLTFDCVSVVFDLMAAHGEAVSPAILDILEVVEDDDVTLLIGAFLKHSKTLLKNTLAALLSAICRCGERIPSLQLWCFSYIQALEDKQQYSVLQSVPQSLVLRLLQGIAMPPARKLVYSVFERLLYPITYPHLLNMLMDYIPDVIPALPEDDIRDNFCALIETLADRFPPKTYRKDSYERLRAALPDRPDAPYKPDYLLWPTRPDPNTKLSTFLQCPVCYERFVTPITACKNGHCICSNCKSQLNNCPMCRAHFSDIRMTVLDQIMGIIDFHCQNSDAGCKVQLSYDDICDHELYCEYRTVSCDIVACSDSPELLCNEDVVVAHFHDHMEKCHNDFVAKFELNSEWRGELGRDKANEVRLLKDSTGTLNFIERIYVTDEEVFFSYHYVGRNEDAPNYVYTVKIRGGSLRKISYTNFCLPNYMGVSDAEADERCIVLEPNRIFCGDETKFDYSVRIEHVIFYRMRLKKNKSILSN